MRFCTPFHCTQDLAQPHCQRRISRIKPYITVKESSLEAHFFPWQIAVAYNNEISKFKAAIGWWEVSLTTAKQQAIDKQQSLNLSKSVVRSWPEPFVALPYPLAVAPALTAAVTRHSTCTATSRTPLSPWALQYSILVCQHVGNTLKGWLQLDIQTETPWTTCLSHGSTASPAACRTAGCCCQHLSYGFQSLPKLWCFRTLPNWCRRILPHRSFTSQPKHPSYCWALSASTGIGPARAQSTSSPQRSQWPAATALWPQFVLVSGWALRTDPSETHDPTKPDRRFTARR